MGFHAFFSTCAAVVLLPFIFLLVLPLFLWRYIVSVLAKIFRSDLVRQVSVRSSVWTKDSIDSSPTSNISTTVVINGITNKEAFHEDFKNKILRRRKINGDLEYERLRQYYKYWLGYSFWTWDKEFDLDRHISIYGDSPDTDVVTGQDEIVKISNEVNRRAWPSKQSPWGFVIIPNYQENESTIHKSVLIFTIHHSLADSFAVQSLFNILVDGKMKISVFNDITVGENNAGIVNYVPSLTSTLSLPFQALYRTIEDMNECGKDKNALKLAETDLIKDRQIVYSPRIPFEHIKELQDAHGVSYITVLSSAIGGGLKKFMEMRDAPIPKHVHMMYPYSHPGHTKELTNYQSFVFLKLPVAEITDPLRRLRMMEKEIQTKKNSLLSQSYSLLPLLLGGMCGHIIRDHYKVLLPSGVMITLSLSTDEPIYFQGHKVDDILFLSGPLPGSAGLFFLFAHYNKGLKIAVCLSESFSTSSIMAEELLAYVVEEIAKLRADSRLST